MANLRLKIENVAYERSIYTLKSLHVCRIVPNIANIIYGEGGRNERFPFI